MGLMVIIQNGHILVNNWSMAEQTNSRDKYTVVIEIQINIHLMDLYRWQDG